MTPTIRLHLVMPFYRSANADAISAMLPSNARFVWHPIGSHLIHGIIAAESAEMHGVSTLPVVTEVPADYDPAYWKLNWWMEWNLPSLVADTEHVHYLGFGCDDDGWPSGFWEYVFDQLSTLPEVFVANMERGTSIPPRAPNPKQRHPITKLFAKPENMIPGGTGLEQLFVRCDCAVPFASHHCADGMMAEQLAATRKVVYAGPDDVSVRFNYLEPGRWL